MRAHARAHTHTHTHTRVIIPQAPPHRGFNGPGASPCSLGKPILRLLGNREERRRQAPFPFWIQIPAAPVPVPFCLSPRVSISLSHHRLLLLAWKGSRERGGGGWWYLGSMPHTGPGSCAAQQCSHWKQRRLTVAIDYGKIVCG